MNEQGGQADKTQNRFLAFLTQKGPEENPVLLSFALLPAIVLWRASSGFIGGIKRLSQQEKKENAVSQPCLSLSMQPI